MTAVERDPLVDDGDGLDEPEDLGGDAADADEQLVEDLDDDPGYEDEDEDDGGRVRRAPWHFKILAVGTVIYLGWRIYQGIGWLVHHA